MRKTTIQAKSAKLAFFLAALCGALSPMRAEAETKDRSSSGGPEWGVIMTPMGGWLNNETKFRIKVPQGSGGDLEYEEHEASISDGGLGQGLTLVGFYKWLTLTEVAFHFPYVNKSRILGNITYLNAAIPTGLFVEPAIGLGFVVIDTQTRYYGFHYELEKELYDQPAVGFADFAKMAIDTRVWALFPKAGVKLNIPIQHWHLTPFYSFMWEDVDTWARSDGGHVQVFYKKQLEDGGPPRPETGINPQVDVDVPAFDKANPKTYLSHLAGVDFFLDFHYFLQLRGKLYYNASYDLWTVRLIGSLLFTEYLGIAAYFEHSQKITVTNTYFLVGPAFVIMPPAFAEKLRRKRRG